MGTRVSYSYEIKMQAIKLRLNGVTTKEVLLQLGIKNKTQVETWLRWYQKGELHRLHQPVGKQYSYNKEPEEDTPFKQLELENKLLKYQLEYLKKYIQLERK